MYGLLDGNNFYASCHRVFRPDLMGKPIVVLSNNDGCVIARSNEAKQLGIKMGVPAFQIKNEIALHDIHVFSSTYALYGDMSNRMMMILEQFVKDVEVYSIDEAFLNFSGMESHYDLKSYGEQITQTVRKNIGIPVSLGIAPTKTLAKVANKFAKKYLQYRNVCIIDSEEKRIKALQKTAIQDVWGIGRQHAKKLGKYGIKTAYDFAQMPQGWVRQQFTAVGERMYLELKGQPCIELELEQPPKKQICTSRTFGKTVTDLEELKESVATYASICAEKLRKQNGCAVALMVFIHTNNFREDLPQYYKNCILHLPVPSNSTLEIVKLALEALSKIYKPGYYYKKAGVIITEIVSQTCVQSNLFDAVDREKHSKIMIVLDKMNSGFAKNKLFLAVQGTHRKWTLKQEQKSPHYTTRFEDILNIHL